ncbi:MAG: hypothetical protein R6X33_17415 [Candidatus Brocadiia bacterium]
MHREPARAPLFICLLMPLAVFCGTLEHVNAAVTLEQREGGLAVRTPRFRALIDPDSGGRILSLAFDGAEMTRITPDGRGGLLEEVHSADIPYQVLDQRRDDGGLHVWLRAQTPEMRITRELIFPPGGPFIKVRFTFENLSPYALSGAAAPAIRNLVLPAGGSATDRELYCLGRGRGAEVLSSRFYAARLWADPGPAELRWMAPTEPVARRAFGFALSHDGCRALPPVRGTGGALTLGWRCPPIPAGGRLTHEFVMVPLSGFTSLAELNEHFAADSLVRKRPGASEVQLTFTPLREPLPEASIITRTYNDQGREGDPCEPMLFEDLPRLTMFTARTSVPQAEGDAACLLHEVYSKGEKLGSFAVPASDAETCVVAPQPNLPAPPVDSARGSERAGNPADLPTDAERARGFTVRDPTVAEFPARPRKMELTMPMGERRTRFLAVRALRDLSELRLTLAGPPEEAGMARGVPPGALRLWRVTDPENGPARLEPFTPVTLRQGESRWFAFTVDTSGLRAGRYRSRLSLSANGAADDIPLNLNVLSRGAPEPDSFGLWYMGCPGTAAADGHALSKLRGYGASGLTLPSGPPEADTRTAGFRLVAHSAAHGALAPSAPSGEGRARPLWLLDASVAPPGVAEAARRRGYVPLPLLSGQRPDDSLGNDIPHLLLRDGGDSGEVPGLIGSGAISEQTEVWAHLDLCEADWRRAAVEVRSACWAAAWQGLAGVSVRVEPPLAEVDRQLVIWHVLRDARNEVALWREAKEAAARLRDSRANDGDLNTATVLALERLEATVGTAEHCTLRLRPRRVPFRRVLRVERDKTGRAVDISRFETARAAVLEMVQVIAQRGANVPTPAPDPDAR